MSHPAVFLDRDGVLVEEVFYPESGEWEAPMRVADVRLAEGAAAAAARLAQAGFKLVVISNQAAHAKGKASLRDLWLAHERFVFLLDQAGVRLDGAYYAYGHPDGIVPHFSGASLDRKPGPYNLFVAAAQLDLELPASWMIGDRVTDIDCGRAASVRGILVENANNPAPNCDAVFRARTLSAAVDFILQQKAGNAA